MNFVKSMMSAISAAACLSVATPANAAFTCLADPGRRLAIDAGGSVLVDIEGAAIINICSMSSNDRGVTKEACAGWYSTLLTYRTMRAKARFYFSQDHYGNAGISGCSGLGDWTARTPYYMEPG